MKQALVMIQKALTDGKLAGSWLITGSDSYAKQEFLRRIFELIFKQPFDKLTTFHPCIKWLECGLTEEAKKEIQKNILAGKSIDENADYAHKHEITVDDVREGLKFLSLKAGEKEWRVLVINPADKMNQSAANAFLKMLEEPPQNTLIFLLAENTGRLLPTIKSRCRKIVLKSFTLTELTEQIRQKYPTAEHIEEIAKLADGSFDTAQMICENNGLLLYEKMTAFLVPGEQVSVKELKDFVGSLPDDDLKLVQKFMLNWLVNWVKENALSNPFYAEDLMETYQAIIRLFTDIDRIYLDKKQVMETAFRQISEVIHD